MYALMFKLKIKIIPHFSGTDDITKKLEKVQISGNFFSTNLNDFVKYHLFFFFFDI